MSKAVKALKRIVYLLCYFIRLLHDVIDLSIPNVNSVGFAALLFEHHTDNPLIVVALHSPPLLLIMQVDFLPFGDFLKNLEFIHMCILQI